MGRNRLDFELFDIERYIKYGVKKLNMKQYVLYVEGHFLDKLI